MSKLVIHIGTHKTATTHVQDTFARNRDLLKRHGVIFPRIGRTRGQHGLASHWIRLPAPYGLRNPARAWKQLVQTHAGSDRTVFVSSEEFSRLRPRRVDMAELRDMTSGFDDVRIVCTLRNQASFLQSVYQQISDERNPGGWKPFLDSALNGLVVDGLALDYTMLLNHILSGFEADRITFLSYEEETRREGGIVGAFLRLLGVPLTAADMVPFSDRNSNVSPAPLATFAANAVTAPAVAGPSIVATAQQSLDAILPAGARTTIFSRPELRLLNQTFTPLNNRLSRRLADTQPGFTVAPMLGSAEGLVWRGRLDEEFWIDLCRRIGLPAPAGGTT